MKVISTNRVFTFFAIFIVCFFVFALRRPEILTNPQFWAEDGAVWYSQAYNMGALGSLILPQNGYYQTISKLVATLSLPLPIYAAPLFFNVIGLAIRCFFVMFLLSSRMRSYPLIGRAVLALFIVLMPQLDEVHANVTNAHWYLSMWLFMVLISEDAKGVYWKAHDYLLLIISGLSGPFIVFLAPVLLLKMSQGETLRNPRKYITNLFKTATPFSYIFACICLIQVIAILTSSGEGRSHAPLGATYDVLTSILSTRVFIGAIVEPALAIKLWGSTFINTLICLGSIAVIAYSFIKGDWRAKSMVIYPVLMLAFALARPQIHMEAPQWPRMQFGAGQRYFVTTNIFWMSIILIGIWQLSSILQKTLTSLMVAIVLVTGYYSFHLQELPNQDWVNEVNRFNHAKPGEELRLKINPNRWTLFIIKK